MSRTCGLPEYRISSPHTSVAGGYDPWSRAIESYCAYQQQQGSFTPDRQDQLFCISTSLAREMGMTLTCDVTGRQLRLQRLPDSSEWFTPRLPGIWHQGKKCGSAGRCSQLWEESEMLLQRKTGTGILIQGQQPCWSLTTWFWEQRGGSLDRAV